MLQLLGEMWVAWKVFFPFRSPACFQARAARIDPIRYSHVPIGLKQLVSSVVHVISKLALHVCQPNRHIVMSTVQKEACTGRRFACSWLVAPELVTRHVVCRIGGVLKCPRWEKSCIFNLPRTLCARLPPIWAHTSSHCRYRMVRACHTCIGNSGLGFHRFQIILVTNPQSSAFGTVALNPALISRDYLYTRFGFRVY